MKLLRRLVLITGSLLTVLPTVRTYDFPLLPFELSSIIYNIISFYFLTYFSALA